MLSPRMLQETADAWNLKYEEVSELQDWIEENVAPWYQAKVFSQLLQRKYKPVI